MFLNNLLKNEKKIALIHNDNKTKYSELYFLVKQISKKIEKNSLILIVVENSLDSIVSYLSSVNSINSTTISRLFS